MARKVKLVLVGEVLNSPWAIIPEKLLEIRDIYLAQLRNESIDLDAIESRLGRPMANDAKPYEVKDGVAVITADGVIAKKMNMFSRISGGVSTQILEQDINAAIADPDVHSLVLSMDSPGGSVDGVVELAQAIRAARGQKPMVAFADGMMGSAAYWLGSAMDRVFMSSDTTQIGSIGVVATHVDTSKAEEARGIKTTEITAGRFKRIASEHAPLTQEGRAEIQDKVDYIYSVFVEDVARNRGKSVETVLENMADGRIFLGKQGVTAGLADGITTLPALISQLNREHASPTTSHREAATMEDKDKKTFDQAALDHAREEGKVIGIAEGAKSERERIQSVEAQTVVGHEELIAKLKFDGKTTGPEAAVQVLAAVKAKVSQKIKDIEADAPKPAAHAAAPAEEPKEDDEKVDPNALAAEAVEYQREQAKSGRTVTVAQAVRHIESKRKKPAA